MVLHSSWGGFKKHECSALLALPQNVQIKEPGQPAEHVRARISFHPDRDKRRIEGCLDDSIHSCDGNLAAVFGRRQELLGIILRVVFLWALSMTYTLVDTISSYSGAQRLPKTDENWAPRAEIKEFSPSSLAKPVN
jgi:hypothetical protein